jgi:hypothetical protein
LRVLLVGEIMLASEALRLVETSPVADIFVSGLGEAEDIGGGCYRFTFYARRHAADGEEVVVVAKLICPIEAVPPAILLAAKAVGFSLAAGAYFPKVGLN